MIWLLFACTTLVVMLPMLPALIEWARPSDVVPLHIDSEDALDPPYLARSFAAHLADAVAQRRTRLGRSRIAKAPAHADWLLTEAERRAGQSRRVWHALDSTELPQGVDLLAEVAAPGNLRAAAHRTYRALWAGQRLQLAPHSTVLRWAHGQQVDVAAGCRLAGRVSADERLTVWGHASFTLLHAPTISFAAPAKPVVVSSVDRPSIATVGLPDPVVWDSIASRGTCDEPLQVRPHSAWRGDLVCRDRLLLGAGCSAHGSLKVRGALVVEPGCRIGGNVVGEDSIQLGAGCTVRGSVVSEVAIVIGEACVIGAPGRPATVAAPRIEIAPGVVVHGTLWAAESGRTQADAVWREMHDPQHEPAQLPPLPRGASA